MTGLRALFLLLLVLTTAAQADLVHSSAHSSTAYFGDTFPARVERYDLQGRKWLAPINLPSARGVATSLFVDAQNIYASYGRAVYRYALDGSAETFLLNATADVRSIQTNATHIFLQSDGTVTSISKATNTVVESKSFFYTMGGMVISPDGSMLYGRSVGVSPADIVRLPVNANGTFGTQKDSPHHGDFPNATEVWVFPNGGRVVDSAGIVYDGATLQYALSFAGTINDLKFHGADVPIVLRGNELHSYSNALLPVGSITLSYTPKYIHVVGDDVLTFAASVTEPNGISVGVVPLDSLAAPEPGLPLDARGLSFTPDDSFVDRYGVVYLFSKAHQSIFRWHPSNQRYLTTIPLVGAPAYVTYSQNSHRIYLAYPTGLIQKIELGLGKLVEEPFATSGDQIAGMVAAEQFLFVQSSKSAGSQTSFNAHGAIVNRVDWRSGAQPFLWSVQNQRIYTLYNSSLYAIELNQNGAAYPSLALGAIGAQTQAPWVSGLQLIAPIRLSPDGAIIVAANGTFHAANNLQRLNPVLGNGVIDIAWLSDGLRTIRNVAGLSQIQQWSAPTYAQGAITQLPGTAYRVYTLPDNRLLAITLVDGAPSFTVYNNSFQIIAPPVLEPPANLRGSIQSVNAVSIVWSDVSGETGYDIERRLLPEGEWSARGTTSAGVVTFSDTSLEAGNRYEYRVRAVNGAQTSDYSEVLHLTYAAPAPPQEVVATKTGTQTIKIDWATSPGVSGYLLERRTGTTGNWSQIATPKVNSYQDQYLSPGLEYFYRVRGVNILGNSPYSEVASATTDAMVPFTPFISASSSGATQVNVSWGGSTYATSYVLERQSGGVGAWEVIPLSQPNATSHSDTNLTPQTLYAYRVKGVSAAGESAYSSIAEATTGQLQPPSPATGVAARPASATSILISWTDSTTETSYVVERRTDFGDEWEVIANLPADQNGYLDEGLTTGLIYAYRVFVLNNGGSSSASLIVEASPLDLYTLVRDDFNAGANPMWSNIAGGQQVDGGKGFLGSPALWFGALGQRSATTVSLDTRSGGVVEFSFRAGNTTEDGAEYWDSSDPNDNVFLEYQVANGSWVNFTTLQSYNIKTWQHYSVAIPMAARSADTRFRWRQSTINSTRADTWALEDVQVRGEKPPLPAAPAILIGMPNSSQSASLLWTATLNTTAYDVQELVGDTWLRIASLHGETTSYWVNGLLPATTYYFRIVSRNMSGESVPSPTAIVQTPDGGDEPEIGTVTFAMRAVSAQETQAGGSAVLYVQRTGSTEAAATVEYFTTPGTAVPGDDYQPAGGTVRFEAGEITRTIHIPLIADLLVESSENFTVGLRNPQGLDLGHTTEATVTILDNDNPGVISFESTRSTVSEGTPSIGVVVRRSGGTSGAVSARYSVVSSTAQSSDYALLGTEVFFAEGESEKVIEVVITDDDVVEEAKECVLALADPTGGAGLGSIIVHTLTITDNDEDPVVSRGSGSFGGLMSQAESEVPAGLISFRTTAKGGVSGLIQIGRNKYPFATKLDMAGQARVHVGKRARRNSRTTGEEIVLNVNRAATAFTATFTDSLGVSYESSGARLLEGSEIDGTLLSQTFTGTLSEMLENERIAGVASFKIDKRGVAKLKGYAPNGRPLNAALLLTIDGQALVAAQVQNGTLYGALDAIRDATEKTTFSGNVWWNVPAKAGVPEELVELSTDLHRYTPGPILIAPQNTPLTLQFFGTESTLEPMAAQWKSAVLLQSSTAAGTAKLNINSAVGTATGSLKSTSGERKKLYGVVIQTAGSAYAEIAGFLGSDRSVDQWQIGPIEEQLK